MKKETPKYNALSNKELKYAEDFYDTTKVQVSKNRLLISNISFIVGALTILGSLFAVYSFIKNQGMKEQKINSLFEPDNPIVKHKELTREISSVRHDMGVADTSILKLSDNKFKNLQNSIKQLSKSQDNFQKEMSHKFEKQTDRLIQVIKDTK